MSARFDNSDPSTPAASADAAARQTLDLATTEAGVWDRGALKNFVRRLGQSSVDSEDIVQEAYLKLLESSNRGRSVGSQLGYLFVIARNLVTDAGRKSAQTKRGTRALHLLNAQLAPSEASAEEFALVGQARERLARALRALPARSRQAFALHRFRGLSHAQIAEVLGVTVRTIERDTEMALNALKDTLCESDKKGDLP